MKQQKADRRSQRTYRLVSSAFAELLGEKPYEEILVQDILDRADIGRTTSPTYVIEPFLPCFTKQGFVSGRYLASWPQKWT